MANTAEQKFARAMQAAGHGKPPLKIVPTLRKGDVHLGDLDDGQIMGINLKKLIDGRLLIQGTSGAGKSWTLRRILEQTAGLVQQILVDPEGEFKSLAGELEMTVVDATKLDSAALATVARRAREYQLSILLDLSELDREDQMKMFAPFISALVDAPKAHWTPCLVAVDEAHLFAPFGGQGSEPSYIRKQAVAALTDLMSRGRKRGLCGAIATQRLAKLSKSVVSEVLNFLIGNNTLDLDIRRAAETVGWDARRAFDSLPSLPPGGFVAVGPAFSHPSITLRVGPVATLHTGAAPELTRPKSVGPGAAARILDLDALAQESAADAEVAPKATQGLYAVRAFIRDPAFPLAGQLWKELVALSPEGAAIADMPEHFKCSSDDVAAAITLLDLQGVLEISQGAVRLSKVMRA